MTQESTYLITGANRGIGLALAAELLRRPYSTVIATVRDHDRQSSSLASLPTATGSKLIVIALSLQDSNLSLEPLLASRGVNHVSCVISNAGVNSSHADLLSTDPNHLLLDLEINTVGQLRLFQAVWPLLSRAEVKKFIYLSSSVGSIKALEFEPMPGITYGPSKAAANWLVKRMGVDFKSQGLLVSIIHPGWVKTEMGNHLAASCGIEEAPMTVEESVMKVLNQIDGLDEGSSGKFLHYDGTELPW